MTIDLETIRHYAQPFVSQLEGPYKWYIMGGVAVLLTAFLTRFVFRTFKWFLLLAFIAILVFGGFYFIASLAFITNTKATSTPSVTGTAQQKFLTH